jgi:hypothetical protein
MSFRSWEAKIGNSNNNCNSGYSGGAMGLKKMTSSGSVATPPLMGASSNNSNSNSNTERATSNQAGNTGDAKFMELLAPLSRLNLKTTTTPTLAGSGSAGSTAPPMAPVPSSGSGSSMHLAPASYAPSDSSAFKTTTEATSTATTTERTGKSIVVPPEMGGGSSTAPGALSATVPKAPVVPPPGAKAGRSRPPLFPKVDLSTAPPASDPHAAPTNHPSSTTATIPAQYGAGRNSRLSNVSNRSVYRPLNVANLTPSNAAAAVAAAAGAGSHSPPSLGSPQPPSPSASATSYQPFTPRHLQQVGHTLTF